MSSIISIKSSRDTFNLIVSGIEFVSLVKERINNSAVAIVTKSFSLNFDLGESKFLSTEIDEIRALSKLLEFISSILFVEANNCKEDLINLISSRSRGNTGLFSINIHILSSVFYHIFGKQDKANKLPTNENT